MTPPPNNSADARTPEWLTPPLNEIPITVALNMGWVEREDLIVHLSHATVYRCGVDFAIAVHSSPFVAPRQMPWGHGADGPCLAVELADGQRLYPPDTSDFARAVLRQPEAPLVRLLSGGGTSGWWLLRLWLWPLPPPGPLTIVAAWHGEGVPETRLRIDGEPLLAAAKQVRRAWYDDRPPWDPWATAT